MMMSSNKEEFSNRIPADPVTEGYGFAFLRSSTFRNNTASSDNGGVANLEKFASLSVQGGGNLFEGNQAFSDGAVFSATTDSTIDVDGGNFVQNESDSVRVVAIDVSGTVDGTRTTRYLAVVRILVGGLLQFVRVCYNLMDEHPEATAKLLPCIHQDDGKLLPCIPYVAHVCEVVIVTHT